MHCRVDGTDEDTLIAGYLAAATDYVEQYTGRSLVSQTWKLTLDAFTAHIMLPRGPVQSVSSVQYYDTAGVLQTVSTDTYTLDNASDPAWLVLNSGASWPDTLDGVNAVKITFVAGYATVPASIKHAVLLLVGDFYANRENTVVGTNQPLEMPHAVTALLANYRAFSF